MLVSLVSFHDPAGHPSHLESFRLLTRSAKLSTGPHKLTGDPDKADLIIITDPGPGAACAAIRASRWWRARARRCFLFNPTDVPWPLLPGFYASLPRSLAQPKWAAGGCYAADSETDRFQLLPWNDAAPYDFSFVGSVAHAPVRQAIAAHWAGKPGCLIDDTTGQVQPAFRTGDAAGLASLTRRLSEATAQSRFVLCPRGVGLCSIRLYETMQMGRVPVILADGWMPPAGPAWEIFSLRVSELDVHRLKEYCQTNAPHARTMGSAARRAWEQWFSPEAIFQTVANWGVQTFVRQRYSKVGWWARYTRQFRHLVRRPIARQEYQRLRARAPSPPWPDVPPAIAQP